MGCIIYFVLSLGKHPFGLPKRRAANIEDEKFNLSDLEGEDKFTAEDLIMAMINKDYEKRFDFIKTKSKQKRINILK